MRKLSRGLRGVGGGAAGVVIEMAMSREWGSRLRVRRISMSVE